MSDKATSNNDQISERSAVENMVSKIHDFDKAIASELLSQAELQSSPKGQGRAVFDTEGIANQDSHRRIETRANSLLDCVTRNKNINRRTVIMGVFGVLVADAASSYYRAIFGRLGELTTDNLVEYYKIRPVKKEQIQLSDNFMSNFMQNRKFEAMENALSPACSDIERRIVDLYGHVTDTDKKKADYFTDAHIEEIYKYMNLAEDNRSKLVFADLLAIHYVRSGNGSDAKQALDSIGTSRIDNNCSPLLANHRLSLAYTGLDRRFALLPKSWDFSNAVQCLDFDLLNEETNLLIETHAGALNVSSSGAIDIPKTQLLDNVYGFYILNWLILYWMASAPHQDLKDISVIHIDLLKRYSAKQGYNRQVWNFAFITGLQCHRQWVASAEESISTIRDKYFSICVDSGHGFHGLQAERKRLQSPKGNDPVALSFAMLLRSEPDLIERYRISDLISAKQIGRLTPTVSAMSIRRAADQFDLYNGRELGPVETWHRYAGDLGTLSIYTENPVDIRMKIKNL